MTQQVDDFADQETDNDFEALDSLISNPKPQPDAADPEEGFDELDELLAGALEERKVAEQVKVARAKAKGGFQLDAADLERIRRWELEREWTAVANTAIFRRYQCACGFHATVFEGMMLEQKHRTDSHAHRWTNIEAPQAGLPNTTAIRVQETEFCQRCAAPKGFELAGATIWKV